MPRLQEHRREEWSKPLTECRQRLQNEMSTTREGKIKLDEEQKRRDAFTARRMMSASHAPVAESPSSSVEHERRTQPSKRARIASEADSSTSTVMQDVTTLGTPGADTTSKTNMRDSSKRQADVGVEELEQDTNDGGDEAATLGDDVEMGVESQGGQAPGLSGVDVTNIGGQPILAFHRAHTRGHQRTGERPPARHRQHPHPPSPPPEKRGTSEEWRCRTSPCTSNGIHKFNGFLAPSALFPGPRPPIYSGLPQ